MSDNGLLLGIWINGLVTILLLVTLLGQGGKR